MPTDDLSAVLDHPADAFRPFSESEREVLVGFVANVRQLAKLSFYSKRPQNMTVTIDSEGTASETDQELDYETVLAALTQLRKIQKHDEEQSFRRAMQIAKLSAHQRGGPNREDAIALFDDHIEAEREVIKQGTGIGIQLGERKITPQMILDAYQHGHYIHSGSDKTALAKQLEELGVPRWTLYTLMLNLRNVYWRAANAIERLLEADELH